MEDGSDLHSFIKFNGNQFEVYNDDTLATGLYKIRVWAEVTDDITTK